MKNNTKHPKLINSIIVITLIILAFYAGIQYKQRQSNLTDNINNSTSYQTMKLTNLTPVSIDNYNILKQKFIKLTVDHQLLAIWNIRQGTYVNDLFPNRYYYSESPSSDSLRIGYYDVTKDLENGFSDGDQIKIAENTTFVYERNISLKDTDKTLNIVGFDGNKLVFYESRTGVSPGICSLGWIMDGVKYEYLDITNDASVPKTYILSSTQRERYQKEEEQCIKDNS